MKLFVYISGWAEHGGAPGLGLHTLDSETGELCFVRLLDDSLSLNASCLDAERDILYVDNETTVLPGCFTGGGGRVFAYQIHRADGGLTQLNAVPTFCPNPSWPQLEPEKRFLLLSNHSGFGTATKVVRREDGSYGYELVYDDATLNLYRLEPDGSIGALVDVVKHTSIVPGRGLHSHPHCIVPSPDGSFYAVADKGDCKIYLYRLDYGREKLVPLGEPFQLPEGSAPRYIVFHPTLPLMYVNQERNMNVVCLRYTPSGELGLAFTASTLPAGVTQPEGVLYEQQGFRLHPSGKWLYSVLNGPNQVAVFRLGEDGRPVLTQNAPMDGQWPRGLSFSPDGRFAVVSCLVSGDVRSYEVRSDGTLRDTGYHSVQRGGSYVTILPPKAN